MTPAIGPVLGLSCDYHDAAAALVMDGVVVAAAEQERFSRQKHDASLPVDAVAACLTSAGLDAADLAAVVFHEKPLRVVSRVLAARQHRGPAAFGQFVREFPTLVSRNAMISYRIDRMLRALGAGRTVPCYFGEHHTSHAAAAFYPSPFGDAAVLTVDGVGEWSTATFGHGSGGTLTQLGEIRYPHSIGLLYSLATVWCGFEANEGEYKLMGLAPFGQPVYEAALRSMLQIADDGAFSVDVDLLGWWSRRPSQLDGLSERLGCPPRAAGEPLEQRHADIAASVQQVTEAVLLQMAAHVHDVTGASDLCLGGGVAMNCVANGRLLRDGPFERVWVQPAPGDAGSAIGAALWWWHDVLEQPRDVSARSSVVDGMRGAALGPRFDPDDVADWLAGRGVEFERIPSPAERADRVGAALADGAVVGWFEGAMEFGPRALGHRSILADPRSSTVQSDLNQRVKGRESFRPFAPVVLWEHASDWFDIEAPSRHMSFTVQVAAAHLCAVDEEPTDFIDRVQVARSDIPACTHVDGSARVQTVHPEDGSTFAALLEAFHRQTGCPVLLNTSFNRAGEPIVGTPADALQTAEACGLDLLVLEDCIVTLRRSEPDSSPPEVEP
ncbi:MAG: carbamoyltransferase [Actinomycetes bacterium]